MMPVGLSRLGQSLRGQLREVVLPRYQRLSRRERGLVLAVSVVLPIALFIFGFWLPVADEIRTIRQELPALQGQLREAQVLANRLQQRGETPASKRNLLALVGQLAEVSGVRRYVTRIRPQPGMGSGQRLLIRMRQVPYPGLVRFLSRLATKGVPLSSARLTAREKPGVVDASLVAAEQ